MSRIVRLVTGTAERPERSSVIELAEQVHPLTQWIRHTVEAHNKHPEGVTAFTHKGKNGKTYHVHVAYGRGNMTYSVHEHKSQREIGRAYFRSLDGDHLSVSNMGFDHAHQKQGLMSAIHDHFIAHVAKHVPSMVVARSDSDSTSREGEAFFAKYRNPGLKHRSGSILDFS